MLQHENIRAKDGSHLAACVFREEQGSRGAIIIGSSAWETQAAYRDLALFFCENGFTVVTFDYRGVGDSAPEQLRGYAATLRQWATLDLDAVVQWVKNHCPGQPIIYFGHGMGGQLAGLAPSSQYFSKIILVNSALTCRRLLSPWRKIHITGLSLLRSATIRLLGYFPGKKLHFLQDLPKGVMTEYSNWCDQPDGLFDLFPDSNYRKIQCPLLAVSFEDDWLAPVAAVEALLRHFSSASIQWKHFTKKDLDRRGLGHSGFLSKEMKAILWQVIIQWMEYEGAFSPGTSCHSFSLLRN